MINPIQVRLQHIYAFTLSMFLYKTPVSFPTRKSDKHYSLFDGRTLQNRTCQPVKVPDSTTMSSEDSSSGKLSAPLHGQPYRTYIFAMTSQEHCSTTTSSLRKDLSTTCHAPDQFPGLYPLYSIARPLNWDSPSTSTQFIHSQYPHYIF